MKIITVVNQKGGVGKSTVACHIVYAAREAGKRILVVDFDTQANTSQVLSRDTEIYRLRDGAEKIFNESLLDNLLPMVLDEHVHLLHGHIHLETMDQTEDIESFYRHVIGLKDRIRSLDYDYILFDTPPSIGPRHIAPMFWSDKILVPVKPTPMDMSGLPSLSETLQGVKQINPRVKVQYVVNMIMISSRQQKMHLENLRKTFGKSVIAELSHRVAVSDALDLGEPVWKHGTRQTRQAWRNFVNNVLSLKDSKHG